jgi:hypothetical protein
LNVCIVCVCYNTYDAVKDYFDSINTSMQGVQLSLDLTVVLVDNSLQKDNQKIYKIQEAAKGFQLIYVANNNTGYFPGVIDGLAESEVDIYQYDYICVTNVDIRLPEIFFSTLFNIPKNPEIGVYAPSIITSNDQVDLNPKIMSRPKGWRLYLNKLIFSNYILYLVITNLNMTKKMYKGLVNKKQQEDTVNEKVKYIYAPHGSFMIFSKFYVQCVGLFDYPMFLFGEELYVAEMAKNNNLLIEYKQELVVMDQENVSTSQVSTKFLRMNHVKSLDYILKRFF